MSSRITITLVGVPGNRKVTATCADCSQSSNVKPYEWMNAHPAECEA